MDKESGVLLQLIASEWTITEADKLLEQYKKCRTAHAQNRIEKKLRHIYARLDIEQRELFKLMNNEN